MASSDSAISQKVIVLCPNAANTSASVISKISLTNEVWATFLPTQIILTVLWCTDVSFSTAFLHYCASEASLIRNFWPAVGCGAVLLTSTRSNIQSAQQQAWLQKKRGKDQKIDFSPTLHKLKQSKSFHLFRISERAICLCISTATGPPRISL